MSRAGFPNAMEDGVVERICYIPQDHSRITQEPQLLSFADIRGCS